MIFVCSVVLNGFEEELVVVVRLIEREKRSIYAHQVLWTENDLMTCDDAAV